MNKFSEIKPGKDKLVLVFREKDKTFPIIAEINLEYHQDNLYDWETIHGIFPAFDNDKWIYIEDIEKLFYFKDHSNQLKVDLVNIGARTHTSPSLDDILRVFTKNNIIKDNPVASIDKEQIWQEYKKKHDEFNFGKKMSAKKAFMYGVSLQNALETDKEQPINIYNLSSVKLKLLKNAITLFYL